MKKEEIREIYENYNKQIMSDMDMTRRICSHVHKMRRENDLPHKLPLYEINFFIKIPMHNGNPWFLLSGHCKLIEDECNAWFVEPFIVKDSPHSRPDAEWIESETDDFIVALRVDISPLQEAEFEFNKAKRLEAQRRKDLGLDIKEK